jgi:hypothetical protein
VEVLSLTNAVTHTYYTQVLKTEAFNVKGKVKVVSVLPTTEHHAMKAYWGVEAQLHPFFDLGTRRR